MSFSRWYRKQLREAHDARPAASGMENALSWLAAVLIVLLACGALYWMLGK